MHRIEISDSAFAFLQRQAVPFMDSPADVLDRLIARLGVSPVQQVPKAVAGPDLPVVQICHRMSDLPSWGNTLLLCTRLDDVETGLTDWHSLLTHLLKLGPSRGLSINDLAPDLVRLWYSEDVWDLEAHLPQAILALSEHEARETIADVVERLDVRLDCVLSCIAEESAEEVGSTRLILRRHAA